MPSLASAEQVLRRGNAAEPESLDPHKVRSNAAINIVLDLYEGLTTEGPGGEVVPGAAAAWQVSADGKAYTFTLRDEARWSNGDVLTAADFVASLRRSVDPATGAPQSRVLAPIENASAIIAGQLPPDRLGVAATDAHTLVIRLAAPAPYLPAVLAHVAAFPVHAPDADGRPVGNGAYRLAEWVPQSHVTLVRNAQYWNDAATHVDRVRYVPAEDAASELKRYRAGELDITDTIPLSQARWIREKLGAELRTEPYLSTYAYGFNLTRPPFKDNLALRRALTLAIDRDAIAGQLFGTGEQPAWSWVPPQTAGYAAQVPEWAHWPAEQRLAEARRLYAEAGYSEAHPLEVEIRFNTGQTHKRLAIAVAWMWQQALGVRTRLVNEEFKVFLQNRRHREVTQVFRAAWGGDYDDASAFAEPMVSNGDTQGTGYSSERYDALVAEARGTADPAARAALLQQAERVLLDDQAVIPLYFYVSKHLVKPYVGGWPANIMDHRYTRLLRIEPH